VQIPLKFNEREFFSDVAVRVPQLYVCSVPLWVYIPQEERQECLVIVLNEVRQRRTYIPRNREFYGYSVLFTLCGGESPFSLKQSSAGRDELFIFPSTMLRRKRGNRSR
jgi:hypothetical protein